jgi:hypothetical protein
MSSTTFYEDLPVAETFRSVAETAYYRPLPDDWHIAVADIADSTGAIERGRYREVNILGASPIVGILNAAMAQGASEPSSIPFAFGGDGATVCVPPDLADDARDVLADIQTIGADAYDLTMRAALVPVTYVREQGHAVRVARVRLSDHFDQAMFTGGGLAFAESHLKAGTLPDRFEVPPADTPDHSSFTGLQCRWQKVPSASGETLSILVHALTDAPDCYRQVIDRIHDIFGEDPRPHPIALQNLTLNLSPRHLMREVKLHSFGASWMEQLATLAKTQLQTALGRMMMYWNTQTSETDWGAYRKDLRDNADYRKFDDMLRLVISGSQEEREQLEAYLHDRYEAGDLVYGLHVSDAALVTCMVFRYQHLHTHFVDGNEGGYTMAAKAMRKRMEALEG